MNIQDQLQRVHRDRNRKRKARVSEKLTERQSEILRFICAHNDKFGYPPTMREICIAFRFKSWNGAHQHVRLIKMKGYVDIMPHAARGIRVLRKA